MRWTDPLDEILGSRAKVRALRVLARAEEPLSGREVARRAGLSHTGILAALAELEEQNAVRLCPGPTGPNYVFNRENELALGIVRMFAVEAGADERLVAAVVAAVPELLSAVVFGSVARIEDGPRSDLDLLVVVPDSVRESAAADAIIDATSYSLFGKIVEPFVWRRSTLARRHRERSPLLDAILSEGRLVWGEPLAELIRAFRRKRAG